MIKPCCDVCGLELKEFGAIYLSPPNDKGQTTKYHICVECHKLIMVPWLANSYAQEL